METLKLLIPIAVAHIFILVVIIFVIRKLLLGDTLRAVDRIKQVEADVRKKEEAIRKDIEEHEKEFARKKAEAEDELQRKKAESEKEVGKLRDQITAEARKEADKIMDQAKRNEEKLKQQIIQSMDEKIVDYAGQTFKLVFSEKMNEEMNKQFINELIEALEQIDASGISVDADNAEFTSSHPMDPAQKEKIEKLIAEKFSVQVKIQEKIKPEILAGLIFKLGSLEIDGSLLNRYGEAIAEVKKSVGV